MISDAELGFSDEMDPRGSSIQRWTLNKQSFPYDSFIFLNMLSFKGAD